MTLLNMYNRINEDSAKRAMEFIGQNMPDSHDALPKDLQQSVA